MDILKGQFLVSSTEETILSCDALKDVEYVALYFSASWCLPCQKFLPLLRKTYELARARQIKFEVIFVPSDHDNDEMTRFFVAKHGPWYALLNGPVAETLRTKFDVVSIPALIILNKDNHVISENGKEDLENNGGVFSKWFSSVG